LLEIRLLGQFAIKQDGEPVEIPSRPARLLFAYLVLTAGKRHPRERVGGLFWPDSDEANARSNLRQALWRLRKAIGEGYLLADNKTVAFDAGAGYWLDATLLGQNQESDLIEAVSVYEGDLLPGHYEDWVLLERERLSALFERKIQRLLDTLARGQRWPDVLHWAEHWIAFGQVPEPAYRSLMVAHAAQGDLAAVSAAYERCLAALQLGIGVEPSAETRELHDRLLKGGATTGHALSPPADDEIQKRPRHNLPHQSTPFIGRQRELAEIKQTLAQDRLLTLIGPGGTGKTRLALQAATDLANAFRNGVFLVALAPISSPDFIVQTVAEAIGFPLSTHEDPKTQLLRHLRHRHYLLMMDNFEHLLPGATLVGEILQTAPEVTILATSQERLNLKEESLLRIEGLAYPPSPSAPDDENYDAVRLFVDSARRQRPGFAQLPGDLTNVSRICLLVEGMPLAILLAAAWADTLTPDEIHGELERSFDFLQSEWRDMPERHRSVRAVFNPSWRRLSPELQALFARLTVFRGGFTREAAEMVTGASLQELAGLVNKSLLRRDLNSGRYEIHELLRQYGQEVLEQTPSENEQILHAHAAYFADFIQKQWDPLTDARQRDALAAIDADLENLRRAWRYWLVRLEAVRIKMFADSFWRVYDIRGWFNAGAELFREASDALRPTTGQAPDQETEVVYAMALSHWSHFLAQLGYTQDGVVAAEESAEILHRLQRPIELAFARTNVQWNTSYVKNPLISWGIDLGGEAIAGKPGTEWVRAYLLCWEGRAIAWRNENETAVARIAESLRLFEARGDYYASVWPGLELGNLAVQQQDFDAARLHYTRVLSAAQENDFDWAAVKATRYLGSVAVVQGEYETAMTYLSQTLNIAEELGLVRDLVNTLYDIAMVEAAAGDAQTAVRLLVLIRRHPLSDQTRTFSVWRRDSSWRIRDLADDLLAELETRLPPEAYAEALEQGRLSDLDAVVMERLARDQ
jgi:predicted ATPase/DNA-binding SARP family transcriptional activator